jgi:hypothetical protein
VRNLGSVVGNFRIIVRHHNSDARRLSTTCWQLRYGDRKIQMMVHNFTTMALANLVLAEHKLYVVQCDIVLVVGVLGIVVCIPCCGQHFVTTKP